MAGAIKKTEAPKEYIKWVAAFLKKHKVSLMGVEGWNLEHTYQELDPWKEDDRPMFKEGQLRWILEGLQKKEEEDYKKKSRATPPLEVWIMGFHTHNMVGSICHVSAGDPYFFTEGECQDAIDNMKSWIGMGDRKQYRPVRFILNKGD